MEEKNTTSEVENQHVGADEAVAPEVQPESAPVAAPAPSPVSAPAPAPQPGQNPSEGVHPAAMPQPQPAPQPQYSAQPQQPQYAPAPQPYPAQPQPPYQPGPAPMMPAPLMQLTGGMKFGWFCVGFLGGIVGMILSWLVNVDKAPQVKSEAIKWSVIGFVVSFVIAFFLLVPMMCSFGLMMDSMYRYY